MPRDETAYNTIKAFDNLVFLLSEDGVTSHCFRVALLEEVTKLNTLVPDVWLIPCRRIVGEGQRPAVRRVL